ncbi:MAG: hypothetical protein JSW54_01705 [Fidelibacterota bacterium]|nr:MAG: hypothetical protein JSW54_01705 [Candidatus Neomarinimicrobiota bacterium]
MELKDKLNLIWKYLLLVVIVFGIFSFSPRIKGRHAAKPWHPKSELHWSGFEGEHRGMFCGPDKRMIRVDKRIEAGDTTVVVFFDGKEVEVEGEYMDDGTHVIKTKDGKVIKIYCGKNKKKIYIEGHD